MMVNRTAKVESFVQQPQQIVGGPRVPALLVATEQSNLFVVDTER